MLAREYDNRNARAITAEQRVPGETQKVIEAVADQVARAAEHTILLADVMAPE